MKIVSKEEIIDIVNSIKNGVIGIDGGDGSGKTTLAKFLSQCTGIDVIHLDDYLNQDRGQFVEEIRLGDLKARMQCKQGALIIEGCCLQALLDKVETNADLMIYVKFMCKNEWVNEEEYNIKGELEQALVEFNSQAKLASKFFAIGDECDGSDENDSLSGFRREIIKYHYKYRPHEKADYIYQRSECS